MIERTPPLIRQQHEPDQFQKTTTADSSWLNWPPAFQFIEDTGRERISPVISVVSPQNPSDNQAARPDIGIVPGREMESRPESIPTSRSGQSDDPTVVEALQEVAGLLAVAYQRYKKIQLMPLDPFADSVNRELAIQAEESVHGGGQRP